MCWTMHGLQDEEPLKLVKTQPAKHVGGICSVTAGSDYEGVER